MLWGFEAQVASLMAYGKLDKASEILREKLQKETSSNPRLLNLLGICEARLGHLQEAKDLFTKALSFSPDDPKHLNNMGNIALLDDDPATARDYYLRAIEKSMWLPEPRYNLAIAYQDMGQFEKAMAAFDEFLLLKRMGIWFRVLFALGILLVVYILFQ
ncbi:MAG: tetratricopeptide repeat protein [Candidatus Fermentithermobacillus carboniphilus]|uniref:Tetratricopeptide repeat protein n=1 Tax=Candidatus Fermentithermobacillus carboniphilus TaxID=3085328 RepID=A0AAT9LD90_9FIRM|nr:MAG: tetratricopeptide repeat protein [Candidatus Fermentithermobacillus carboniphilus]